MGLDPPTLTSISALLCGVANTSSPRVLLSLRPQDLLPDWITHVLYLGSNLRILHQGRKDHLPDELAKANPINAEMRKIPVSVIPKDFQATSAGEMHVPKHSKLKDWSHDDVSRDGFPFIDKESPRLADENETLVEMENVQIKYGQKQVLGGWKEKVNGVDREGLWWKIKRGERWAIFGPNGNPPNPPFETKSRRPLAKNQRLRKNNTPIFDQFGPPSVIFSTHQNIWAWPPSTAWPVWDFYI